jgi:hypothetical protein
MEMPEQIVRVTMPKNPKKVEAGRKGAAARQTKKEQLLDELRKAKSALLADKPEINQDPLQAASGNQTKELKATDRTKQDWTPYVVGGLGIAGALWLLWSSRLRSRTGCASPPSVVVSAAAPAKQLEIEDDIFKMR